MPIILPLKGDHATLMAWPGRSPGIKGNYDTESPRISSLKLIADPDATFIAAGGKQERSSAMLDQQDWECAGQPVAWRGQQQNDAGQPEALPSIARVRRFGREQEIYSPEDRSDTWYRMVSGAARKYVIHASGRRQIVDIHLPGDFFGFTPYNRHRFGVQLVIDGTSIECYPRQRLEALADANPALAREIRMRSFEAIERLQEQMLIVGTMTAKEKVRAFLIYFCERISKAQDEGAALPISRYDMADLLGISVETVCRVFTELQQRGAISLQGPRRVKLTRRVDRL